MISAVEGLLAEGCRPEVTLAAVHGVMADGTPERFAELPIKDILVTDSIAQPKETSLPLRVCSIQGLVADTIKRLHANVF